MGSFERKKKMGKHKKSKKSKKRSRSSSSSSSDNEKKKRKRSKKDKKGLKSIDELIKERLKNKPEKVQNFAEEEKKIIQQKPMTKEEYDKKQSVVKRVFDEDTGRMRLVKGDGEIIEEIVSASRQKEINKLATQSDGQSFQSSLNSKLK